MIKWGDPSYLKIVWVVVALYFVFIFLEKRRSNKLSNMFGAKNLNYLTGSVSRTKRGWHLLLQVAVMAFLALALARPLLGSRQTEIKQTGIEIIVAVDVSNSMLAEDEKPSRLIHAKRKIITLLDRIPGSQVGLIAFAGSAHLVSPMTSDPSAIRMYLSSLSTESVSSQGTNFKAVIDEAIRAFDRGGVETLSGNKPTRVLLIASDGEDNEPGVYKSIEKAKKDGIRIFALGFGTAKGAPIPIRDDRGTLRSYKKDKKGETVLSVPKDKVLSDIARAGGGSYYHSTFTNDEIMRLTKDLDRLEKADFKSRISTEYDEKYQIPLAVALLLAFFDLLFGDRRHQRVRWKGRFEVNS